MSTKRLTIDIPDEGLAGAGSVGASALAREIPLLAAVKLYELGRLSSGRAAMLAGLTRLAFPETLGRYRVSPLAADAD